jgi:hypothetical protein
MLTLREDDSFTRRAGTAPRQAEMEVNLRALLCGKEPMALLQNLRGTHAEEYNNDDPYYEPASINQASQVERRGRKRHELEVDHDGKQNEWSGGQKNMLHNFELTAMLTQVKEWDR